MTRLVITLYVVVSVAVTALAFTDRPEAAIALGTIGYSGLGAATHQRLSNVAASVGPGNGKNVRELLHSILRLEEYTHARMHDVLSALSPTNARLELDLLELLDRQPTEEEEDGTTPHDRQAEGRRPAEPQEGSGSPP